MLFRNLSPEELTELSRKIDCVSFMQYPHFTFNPCPERMTYSKYPANDKETEQDQLNKARIDKIIQEYKKSQN